MKLFNWFKKKESFDDYCRNMDAIRDNFIKEKKIEIGKMYSGVYFRDGIIHQGFLIDVDASVDGIFATLKTENGMIQDINAYTLIKI